MANTDAKSKEANVAEVVDMTEAVAAINDTKIGKFDYHCFVNEDLFLTSSHHLDSISFNVSSQMNNCTNASMNECSFISTCDEIFTLGDYDVS